MRVPFILGRGSLATVCLLIAACDQSPAADPSVLVEYAPRADTPPSMEASPRTLRQAARTLDTLFAPPPDAPAAAAAVMAALRDIRNGRMDATLGQLVPVADRTGPEADVAREILGELLFHRGEWAALAGSAGGAAPLFAAFARAEREEWVFPTEPAMLPLEVTPVGTPVVEVRVNGVTRGFWVDTGAKLTVVSSELAAEAGIPVGESGARAGTVTSREVAARPAVVAELRIGPVRVRNHPAIVIDAADLRFRSPELPGEIAIDGILGWPLIRRLDLTLDFARRNVVIREPTPRRAGGRNLFWLGVPAVAARADNGRTLLLGLDTGAVTSSLAPGFLESAGVRPDGTRSRRVGGAGGFETVTVQTLDTAALRLDDWRIRFREIDVRDAGASGALDLDGVLGSDIAARRILRIDFLNGRLDLLPPGGERP